MNFDLVRKVFLTGNFFQVLGRLSFHLTLPDLAGGRRGSRLRRIIGLNGYRTGVLVAGWLMLSAWLVLRPILTLLAISV